MTKEKKDYKDKQYFLLKDDFSDYPVSELRKATYRDGLELGPWFQSTIETQSSIVNTFQIMEFRLAVGE